MFSNSSFDVVVALKIAFATLADRVLMFKENNSSLLNHENRMLYLVCLFLRQ